MKKTFKITMTYYNTKSNSRTTFSITRKYKNINTAQTWCEKLAFKIDRENSDLQWREMFIEEVE